MLSFLHWRIFRGGMGGGETFKFTCWISWQGIWWNKNPPTPPSPSSQLLLGFGTRYVIKTEFTKIYKSSDRIKLGKIWDCICIAGKIVVNTRTNITAINITLFMTHINITLYNPYKYNILFTRNAKYYCASLYRL